MMQRSEHEKDQINWDKKIEAFMRKFYNSQEPISIITTERGRVYTLGSHEATFQPVTHLDGCELDMWNIYNGIRYIDYIANEQFYREIIALNYSKLYQPTLTDLAKVNPCIHVNCLTTKDIMKQVLNVRPELKEILLRAEVLEIVSTSRTSEKQARLILERQNAWDHYLWILTENIRRGVLVKHFGTTYEYDDNWRDESLNYQNKGYVIGLAEALRKASEEIKTGLDDGSLITKLANKCREYLDKRQQKYLKGQSLFKQNHQNSDRSDQHGQLIEIVRFGQ